MNTLSQMKLQRAKPRWKYFDENNNWLGKQTDFENFCDDYYASNNIFDQQCGSKIENSQIKEGNQSLIIRNYYDVWHGCYSTVSNIDLKCINVKLKFENLLNKYESTQKLMNDPVDKSAIDLISQCICTELYGNIDSLNRFLNTIGGLFSYSFPNVKFTLEFETEEYRNVIQCLCSYINKYDRRDVCQKFHMDKIPIICNGLKIYHIAGFVYIEDYAHFSHYLYTKPSLDYNIQSTSKRHQIMILPKIKEIYNKQIETCKLIYEFLIANTSLDTDLIFCIIYIVTELMPVHYNDSENTAIISSKNQTKLQELETNFSKS